MKSILVKFIPGAALVAAAVAIAAVVHAQTPNQPAAAPVAQAQVIYCGACGAVIQQPAPVLVAQPVYYPSAAPGLVRGPNGYYFADDCGAAYACRIPPAPVFSLTDYWRADPRLVNRGNICAVPSHGRPIHRFRTP